MAWLGLPGVTRLSGEDELIVSTKVSLPSTRLSLVNGILNAVRVCPAENVTVYGPES